MIKPEIIFENADFLVVDKPTGLAVHEGIRTGETLIDFLAEHLPESPLKTERYGLVHRLDQATSGLLVVAKTSESLVWLKRLFKSRKVTKVYLALVEGKLTPRQGIIDIPLARDIVKRQIFTASSTGRPAVTQYEVIHYHPTTTYLKAMPQTGRTHQIRVHLAMIGHPIVGDTKYNRVVSTSRLFLHAHQLEFTDQHGQTHSFISPLPADLEAVLKKALK